MSLAPNTAAQAGLSQDIARKMEMDALQKRIAPGPTQEKKLQEACEGFEAVFIGQMIKEMRKSVPKDGLLHSSYEDQYVSMFDEELSKNLAKGGGIGLAEFMRGQLAERAKNQSEPKAKGQDAVRQGVPRTAMERLPVSAPGKRKQEVVLADALSKPGQAASAQQALGQTSQTLGQTQAQAQTPGQTQQAQAAQGRATQISQAQAQTPGQTQAAQGRAGQALAAQGRAAQLSQAQATQGRGLLDRQAQAALAGTPSQHLGAPGAAYLQGDDAALAALPAGATAQPVQGEITSDFGWRRDPFTHQKAWHNGVDIAAPQGTPVSAFMDGKVVFSGPRQGYGNLVIVEHPGGMQSYYGHNASNTVAEGQSVRAGQVIARVGQTGRATGPHLHFEVRVADKAVDPVKLGTVAVAAASPLDRLIPDL